jgi:hypothetical protein
LLAAIVADYRNFPAATVNPVDLCADFTGEQLRVFRYLTASITQSDLIQRWP